MTLAKIRLYDTESGDRTQATLVGGECFHYCAIITLFVCVCAQISYFFFSLTLAIPSVVKVCVDFRWSMLVRSCIINQSECCKVHFFAACHWKNQTLPDGYRWKENGVDFFCSSQPRVKLGCYLTTNNIFCTGAFTGRLLSHSFRQLEARHVYLGKFLAKPWSLTWLARNRSS